jgi:hypothetical protein
MAGFWARVVSDIFVNDYKEYISRILTDPYPGAISQNLTISSK